MARSSSTFLVPVLALAGFGMAAPSLAAGLKVAVVAPTEGPFAILGKQMLDGARFQAESRDSEIIAIPESCEARDGDALAKALIASGAEAAIGFACTESLEATLPALAEAGIPALTLSVRSGILMEDALKKKWPLFRMAPSAAAEPAKIVDIILTRWRNEPIALIDDGTIHGRELVESVRNALAEVGMTPVFTDTYRPAQEQQVALVRRLSKSGASHVFVGGDRSDISIIARDAKAEAIDLELMGSETLSAANQPIPLADGVLAVTLPDYAALPEAKPVVDGMGQSNLVAEGYVLPAFAAVTLLEQAKDQAEKDGGPLIDALTKGPYKTAIGPVQFNANHELTENPYRLQQWRSGRFMPAAAATE